MKTYRKRKNESTGMSRMVGSRRTLRGEAWDVLLREEKDCCLISRMGSEAANSTMWPSELRTDKESQPLELGNNYKALQ